MVSNGFLKFWKPIIWALEEESKKSPARWEHIRKAKEVAGFRGGLWVFPRIRGAIRGGYMGLYTGYIGFRVFAELGIPCLGVPIPRIIVFWGSYWGLPILRNYSMPRPSKFSWKGL